MLDFERISGEFIVHAMYKSNAVIVRAGSNSLHLAWLLPDEPDFDLYVLAYEACPSSEGTSVYEQIELPGTKVGGWQTFFRNRPEFLSKYQQIALIDDDIKTNSHDINEAFRLGKASALWLWQPSLSWDSHFTYAIFLKSPFFRLRYVNFVEMMCPFFSSDHLKVCLPLFELGYETGIDRLWCRLRKNARFKYAVLDAVTMKHTKSIGVEAFKQGFIGNMSNYQVVIDQMEQRFDVYFRGPVAYSGESSCGRKVNGRLRMAFFSLLIVAGIRQAVQPRWFRKSVSDHLRHILTRPIQNDSLDILKIYLSSCD